VQTAQSGTNGQTTESALRDRGINHSLVAEAIQQSLGDLVCAVVLGNLLSQDEGLGVGLELLSKSLVEGISDGVLLNP
jgi:hypothetical protein